jgi:hypothetical protein
MTGNNPLDRGIPFMAEKHYVTLRSLSVPFPLLTYLNLICPFEANLSLLLSKGICGWHFRKL